MVCQSRFNSFQNFVFIRRENSRFHHVCVTLTNRGGLMIWQVVYSKATFWQTNLKLICTLSCGLGNRESNCKICASTNPSDYMKSKNAENKLICFSNPATNVHTTVFLSTPIWEWRRNLFTLFFGGGRVRHVCMIFFLACMYCCLSVSDDDIFLRKFFNPHLPPFQVSTRPSLEFESVLLNDEFSIFSQWQWISAY